MTNDPDPEPEPEAEPDDPSQPATPLPGFEWNPIVGLGGVGAFEGDRDPRRLIEDEALGGVLVRVEGGRDSPLALALLGVMGLLVCGACGALAYADELAVPGTPWSSRSVVITVAVTLVVAVVVAGAWLSRLVIQGGEVLFGANGVAKRRAGKLGTLLPWEAVRGWRLAAPDHLLLACDGGAELAVPTPREEDREQVIRLLDERGVPRLD